MPDVNLIVASQLRSLPLLPNARGKILSSPLNDRVRSCFCCKEAMSPTYHDGQTEWFEVCLSHKVVAIETPLQYQTVQKQVLKAIDAE